MALIQFSVSPSNSVRSSPSVPGRRSTTTTAAHSRITASVAKETLFNTDASKSCCSVVVSKRNGSGLSVKCSLETVGPTATVGQVTEVCKDTFWPIVKDAGDKTVVLDMYTQWCGPCKVIAPKFKALSEKYLDVVFLKLDCNQDNKSLAKELGIKVVPTFKILKDSKIVKEVTGAKYEDLLAAIDAVRSG
ncbi:thioredoxin F-type, chloroplastic-like [Mercurialis annua]|uniref:thioredoxin F-type, chloroplastic-like n=1 Tax=Mercurialis annua TaxID=3986 RepID=UPI00215E8940|nr:thioredoxin F-type, chloroplastic-like [Mercurialis annua]